MTIKLQKCAACGGDFYWREHGPGYCNSCYTKDCHLVSGIKITITEDTLKAGVISCIGGGNKKTLQARLDFVDDVIVSCIDQFLMYDEDKKEIYHSFMAAEEKLCAYAVDAGMIEPVPGKHERYRWVKK